MTGKPPARRVAVTGLGCVTCLGPDAPTTWRLLLQGASGFTEAPCRTRVRNLAAGYVLNAPRDPEERMQNLAATAGSAALDSAGLAGDSDFLPVIGTSLGAYLDNEAGGLQSFVAWASQALSELGSFRAPVVLSTSCSSGSDAILIGAQLIRSGHTEACLCGSADVVTDAKRVAHSVLGTMSYGRPAAFDEAHDGMLLGEGAGFLLLESERRASLRGVVPYAWLIGVGSANDAAGPTKADTTGDGLCLAIRRAVADAGLTLDEIGLIGAHGSGTVMNDTAELSALRVLSEEGLSALVFATKSAVGHTLGATGAIGAATMILALRHGVVPPNLRLARPIPCPMPVPPTAQAHTARIGISQTLAFGGFITVLVFGRV